MSKIIDTPEVVLEALINSKGLFRNLHNGGKEIQKGNCFGIFESPSGPKLFRLVDSPFDGGKYFQSINPLLLVDGEVQLSTYSMHTMRESGCSSLEEAVKSFNTRNTSEGAFLKGSISQVVRL